MKAIKLLFASILALAALVGVVLALAWGRAAPARAEDAVTAPAAPQTLPLPYLSDTTAADAPYGTSPNVDGRIAPGEYAGADKVTFPGYGGDVEVFFREDGSYLYVAFDFSAPQTPGSAAQVFLDTNHDRASAPQTDDYRLSIIRSGTLDEMRGTGSGWGGPTAPISWTAATTLTLSGWQAEFRIQYNKLGLTPGTFKVLGLALRNGGLAVDYYWPAGASSAQPASWGNLTSSSNWATFYWKPGPWEDYAPSGLPDFDQRQANWFTPTSAISTHCGPVAMANSLWWFDSKFETLTGTMPPVISDTYRLITSYNRLQWDDHYFSNVVPLVDNLANNYFGTNQGGILGTNVISMFYGTQRYLRDRGLWDDYAVTLVISPSFKWVADEVMRSEDVILLLGFWEDIDPGPGYYWVRVGGHFVTVAGVDPATNRIAFSDPATDNAEAGGQGRVLSGTLIPHQPIPGHGSTIHNDAGNVSHDIYPAVTTNSPGGTWGPELYPWEKLEANFGANPHPEFPTEPYLPGPLIQIEVEFALAVSPYDWKASGEWIGTSPVSGTWQPWADYAPNGVPDFDQKQDNWVNPLSARWSFCGPVAAANSLWWFDSKFEPSPITPTTSNDNYPLVQSYDPAGAWDDHDPLNVDDPATAWPTATDELVEDLARYFDTDGQQSGSVHAGTVVTDLYAGIVQYITAHNLRQGYVITMVNKPEFWWTAEEVEVSEDVILLLGFWDVNQVRLGGHYVTLPGVDRQGGFVAFSDPWFDRIEQTWPYAGIGMQPGWPWYTGRVADGRLIPHPPYGAHPAFVHNDAGNVSHDIYRVVTTTSPGGVWGPLGYVTSWSQIENFQGQNDGGATYTGGPIQTEVEWAVAVSPIADVFITKTVSPAVVMPGAWVTFTVQFGNAGSLPAENVVISDAIPAGLVGVTYTYTLNYTGTLMGHGTFTWTVGTLNWNEGGIITITARADPAIRDPQRLITNTAAITTTTPEQYQVHPLPNVSSAVVTVQTADVAVTKSAAPTVLRAGEWLTYTIVYTNAGPATASNMIITDQLHSWLVNASFSDWKSFGGPSIVGDRYVWGMGNVPAGGWGIITVTAQISPSLGGSGTLPNTVSISTDTPESDSTNNSGSANVTIVYNGVALQPASGGIAENPGKTVTYTLALYNTGNVTDTYAITGAVSGQAWPTSWPATVGPLAAGGSAPVVVTVQIPPAASGWSQAVITATSQGDRSKKDTSVLTTTVYSGVITRGIQVTPISPTVNGDPGSTVCFTLTVTNTGNVTDTVSVTHTFPLSWTVTFAPLPPYLLPPGGSQAVHTCITIPSGAGGGSSETDNVTISSQGDPAVHTDVNVTVRVGWRFIYLPLVLRNYP
jgi:uncharacterized repeat protein (TIGR01451 family)